MISQLESNIYKLIFGDINKDCLICLKIMFTIGLQNQTLRTLQYCIGSSTPNYKIVLKSWIGTHDMTIMMIINGFTFKNLKLEATKVWPILFFKICQFQMKFNVDVYTVLYICMPLYNYFQNFKCARWRKFILYKMNVRRLIGFKVTVWIHRQRENCNKNSYSKPTCNGTLTIFTRIF